MDILRYNDVKGTWTAISIRIAVANCIYYIRMRGSVQLEKLLISPFRIDIFLVVMNMRVSFYTLGCKVNQYETQAMEQILARMGIEPGDFEDSCDAYIINTCTVTAMADKKNRNIIRRCRKRNPDAIVGVCGCYSQLDPDTVAALGADVISGSGGREEFLQLMLQALRTREKSRSVDKALARRGFERLPAGGLSARTRAMLKVQDGCCNFCSYFIIPYARGPVRSLPLEEAVAQAKQLCSEGYREIVITGIEIASWGRDLPGKPKLTALLQALCEAAPVRLRLGSLEPRIVDEEFCQVLSRYPQVCPQFHLSMQSGSDTVLKRMNRKYDSARYFESVQLLRQYFPGCAVTTDLIVGFPGESEAEFEESLAFVEKCGLSQVHVFPYSRRPGTPADRLPDQILKQEKERRSALAIERTAKLADSYRQAMVGTVQQVLFEQPEKGLFAGHAMNYVKVYAPGEDLQNEIREVKITEVFADGVKGEIV